MKSMFSLACLLAALPAFAHAEPPRVVVIGIDKKTQAELGPFGGSYRGTHADLIKKLNASGVKGIAFDMFLPENAEQAAGTAKLAAAAKASTAPVVVGVYMEDQQGQIAKLPNAAVLQDSKIGQGAVMTRRELEVVQDGDDLVAKTGAYTIMSEAGGHRSLVEELLRRTGDAKPGQLEELGLVEQVPTGFQLNEAARTQGLEHGYSRTPALRPELDRKPLTLSYVDVLRKKPHPALKGAIVIIGMNDGVNDVHETPDPSKPKLKKVSGVYIHAALAERLLREVPAREAARQAAKPVQPASDRKRKGLSQLVDAPE